MTNLIEKKMELETLYNQLLMQHESLPSEIHKEWNQKAMDCIDEGLSKIEKELTIELEFPAHEEVETDTTEESTVAPDYYEKNLIGMYELVNDTTIELYEKDCTGCKVLTARYNFETNSGYFITLDHKRYRAYQFSKILNYFFSIDENFGYPMEKIKALRKQARLNRKDRFKTA